MEKVFILPPTPTLKSDLFDRLCLEINRYQYQQSNTYDVRLFYRKEDTGVSHHQLGTWYAEMMYIADRQPTLAQSLQFKDEIIKRVVAAIDLFMEEYCNTHPTFTIEVSRFQLSHQLSQNRIEFYWRPK
jgi:hypothetical protein